MSSPKVRTAIQRAKSDPQFAALVLRSPTTALATYNLTQVEIDEVLRNVNIGDAHTDNVHRVSSDNSR